MRAARLSELDPELGDEPAPPRDAAPPPRSLRPRGAALSSCSRHPREGAGAGGPRRGDEPEPPGGARARKGETTRPPSRSTSGRSPSRRRPSGRTIPDVGVMCNNLAAILRLQGDYAARGRSTSARCASTRRRSGRTTPTSRPDLNNLGVLARDTGRLDEALALFGRSLALCEKANGPDHPDVAVTLANLGNVRVRPRGPRGGRRAPRAGRVPIFARALGEDSRSLRQARVGPRPGAAGPGPAAARRGRCSSKSLAACRRLLARDPASPRARGLLAAALVELGRLRERGGDAQRGARVLGGGARGDRARIAGRRGRRLVPEHAGEGASAAREGRRGAPRGRRVAREGLERPGPPRALPRARPAGPAGCLSPRPVLSAAARRRCGGCRGRRSRGGRRGRGRRPACSAGSAPSPSRRCPATRVRRPSRSIATTWCAFMSAT